uniref:Neur_chan_LBD domain-containing protein n=1 Tax=Macrostomum lignano TaxID=282301 RepID=A0A1I8IBP1_9PLAT
MRRYGQLHQSGRILLLGMLRLNSAATALLAAILIASSCQCSLITDEQRILSALMSNYLPSTPPTMNRSKPIVVEVSFRLNQIIDLDERNQILTTNVFIEQKWNDTKLSWDSDAATKDTKLRISADKVWLPDTYVFNNADSRKSGFLRSVYVLLQPDGQVSWPVPDKLRTTCQVNIANFPFDYQKCRIRLGSWVHSRRQLVFLPRTMDGIDEMDYTDNSEWQLLSAKPFVRNRQLSFTGHLPKRLDKTGNQYVEPNRNYSDLVIELIIRRRSFFYVWNIILPCVMLSVLTLFTFRVPPDNCEKISMGLSVFLAFSMFMLLVAEQVPATSESVPLIGLYITVLMSMTTVSVIFSVCIVNLNHRGSKFRPPPRLLKRIFVDWLGRLLRVADSVEKAARQFEVV